MFILLLFCHCLHATQDSKRLFDDLMLNYNSQQRAGNPNQQTVVHVRLSLSQIIDLVSYL
jgi:hypothetical protein